MTMPVDPLIRTYASLVYYGYLKFNRVPARFQEGVNTYLQNYEGDPYAPGFLRQDDLEQALTAIDSKIEEAIQLLSVDSKITEAFEALPLSQKIDEAIDLLDIASMVDGAIQNLSIDTMIEEAIQNLDLGTGEAYSANLYVNGVTGNNTNPGTLASPYKTIQKALDVAIAGDTVHVMNGTYKEQVKFKRSGTPTKPITLRAYLNHAPIIDGTGITWGDNSSGALIQFDRHSHLVIEGIKVQNSAAYGFGDIEPVPRVKNMKDIKIKDCSTLNTFGCGINVSHAYDVELVNCTVVDACENTWDECISLVGVDGFEVKDCTVLDSVKEGIDMKVGTRNGKVHGCTIRNVLSVGIYIDAWDSYQYNIEVYDNVVSDVLGAAYSTGVENGGRLDSVVFHNNIAYNCNRGFNLTANSDESGLPYILKDIVVRNNTIFNIAWEGIFFPAEIKSVLIENNILFMTDTASSMGIHVYDTAVTDRAELVIRNNMFRESWDSPTTPLGDNYIMITDASYLNVMKDPRGTVTGTRDFSLAVPSVARGAGYMGQDIGASKEFAEGLSAYAQVELFKVSKFIPVNTSSSLIETRTSDPTNPEVGRLWLRTDL